MNSIRKKMNLLVSLTALLSIVIVTAITFWTFYHSTLRQNSDAYLMLAEGYMQAVDNKISIQKKQLEMAAKQDDITKSTLSDEKKNDLLGKLAQNTGFDYISVADSKGKTYRSSDISDREYFKQALAGTDYMSDPVVNKVDGKLTFMFAVPVQNGTGFKGTVYGGISYDVFINELISNIKIGKAGYAFMVNKEGTIIASPDLAAVTDGVNYITMSKDNSEYESAAAVITDMTAGCSGTEFMTFNNEHWLVSFVPMSGPEGCSIALAVPLAQVMQDYYNAIKQCALIGVILTVLALVISTLLSGKITKPLSRAVQRIKLLAQGDLQTKVEMTKGKDEVAVLTSALNDTITQIQTYINDISSVLTSMACNDFTVESSGIYKGDFLPIKEALSKILDSLGETISVFNTATKQFDTTAKQMDDTSRLLAGGASEQANSIEELASTITDVLEEVHHNAQDASSAKALADKAMAAVDNGNKQMEAMTRAMNGINESSSEISKIIKVIDDIAFQTNILALNAAVEAARAGAAGKGFAVVADEVRSLAAKSAEAAGTTSTLIKTSQLRTTEGAEIACGTGNSLKEIVLSMSQIAELIDKINKASAHQEQALDQIVQGVKEISSVVQTSTVTAEESSALSNDLSLQADRLHSEISKFKMLKS